jgi:hypothetical protein
MIIENFGSLRTFRIFITMTENVVLIFHALDECYKRISRVD